MSDFISDVEQQYEAYCKIAEDCGFIDLNAKKNGFRCATKSSEFNAGWIAFTGGVTFVRDARQAEIDQLKAEKAGLEKLIKEWRKSANWMCATDDKHVINSLRGCADDLEKALRGEHE